MNRERLLLLSEADHIFVVLPETAMERALAIPLSASKDNALILLLLSQLRPPPPQPAVATTVGVAVSVPPDFNSC